MKKFFFLCLSLMLWASASAQSADGLSGKFLDCSTSSQPLPSVSGISSLPFPGGTASRLKVKPLGDDSLRVVAVSRWGLKNCDFPLPSLDFNLGVGRQLPQSDNNRRLVTTYNVELSLTPWQFRLPVRRRAFFHGGWSVGAYGKLMPEHVMKKIAFEPYEGREDIMVGLEVPNENPGWEYGYEVGVLMRFPLAWTFVPKRPDAGYWTIGLEPEIRYGFLDQRAVHERYRDFPYGPTGNLHIGLNAFAQYRKGNWSVNARIGLAYDAMNLYNLNASLGVGYHF